MKIRNVIFTLAGILLALGVICYFFPQEGVEVCGIKLKFPTLEDIFVEQKAEYVNIDHLVQDEENQTNQAADTVKVVIDDKFVTSIIYPGEDMSLLNKFFADLEKSDKKKVRILHYGDSQIEGDRITSYIRQRLQGKFSGQGQGEIPLFSLSSIKGVRYSSSDNWQHKSIIGKRDKGFARYGLMMTACVPTVKMQIDSLTNDTTYKSNAWINLKFDEALTHDIHLYCSSPRSGSNLTISSKGNILVEKHLTCSEDLLDIRIPIAQDVNEIRIQASGPVELYSLDISGKSGVYVDNISLRGSSGWGFNWNDAQLISDMAKALDVKLIIMQFGVNAIPQDPDKVMPSYDFFRKEYSRQLAFLKQAVPDAAIIVVGASDRSRKKGDSYQTNPNVPKLIEAQMQAAKENNCLFWNTFEAMGGENSMPSWVLRDKPLANPDFVHFNARGAKYIAEMFYKAFELEYKKYLINKK